MRLQRLMATDPELRRPRMRWKAGAMGCSSSTTRGGSGFWVLLGSFWGLVQAVYLVVAAAVTDLNFGGSCKL